MKSYDNVRTLQPQRKTAMTTETTIDKPKLDLDLLLKQQQELEQKIKDARKETKEETLKQVKNLIVRAGITSKDLAGIFGFEAPEELKKKEKKVYGKAKPKYQWTDSEGKVQFWSGRGSSMTTPKTLLAFLKEKKLTISQFKENPEYKYKG